MCACCGRACSTHEEHLHCGVSQFFVFHAGRQQEGRGGENEQGTSSETYLLPSLVSVGGTREKLLTTLKERLIIFEFNESSRAVARVRESF